MKIAVFGGTFNPVHNGHTNAAKVVMEKGLADKMIVIPDRIPPHKQAENLASGKDRLNMCRLAFLDIKGVEFSDWELKQTGKSYSVKTLRHFHQIFPEDRLYFLMGSDMLLSFRSWYKWEEILTLSGIICLARNEEDINRLEPFAEQLRREGGEVIIVNSPPLEISSTQIRENLKKNCNYTCYLQKNVVQYIVDNNLYDICDS